MSSIALRRLSLIFLFAGVFSASGPRPALAETNPVLVELFTSEGCSDCPPADALLRTLDMTQPIAAARLIVLEEHVDYWDDQGWRDPFSSHELTLRQGEYVDRMRLETGPYTPQMVVDGTDAFVGNDRRRAGQALEKAATVPKINVKITGIKAENGKVLAHISTGAVPSKADVYLAIALDHAQSQVLRGENGGRSLEHVAVARNLARVGKISQGQSYSGDVAVPVKSTSESLRAIVFLQEPNQGRILGAAFERVPPNSRSF